MESRDEPQPDPQLELFLDGLLDPSTREAYARKLKDDPELRQSAKLQDRIDASLKRQFGIEPPPDPTAVALWLSDAATSNATEDIVVTGRDRAQVRWRYWYWVTVALAASVAWCAVIWQLGYFGTQQPFFEPRPLVQLYREAVQAGFKPYYECRDEARFADTFRVRQGIPLRLLPLPEGTRMRGLSYAGGLSRQTTAMLCQAGDTPVMVFVDRASRDTAVASRHEDSGIHVFRTEKYGLVFYEVSPLAQTRVTEFLVSAD